MDQKWREMTNATPLALGEEEAISCGMQVVSRTGKGNNTESLLELPERMQRCRLLVSRTARRMICFKRVNLWPFVRVTAGDQYAQQGWVWKLISCSSAAQGLHACHPGAPVRLAGALGFTFLP